MTTPLIPNAPTLTAPSEPSPPDAEPPCSLRGPSSTGYFPSRDGLALYHEVWQVSPEGTASPKQGLVLFLHGYGDHCGRYGRVMRLLSERGYTAVGLDYRGHGRAQGPRGHCKSFGDYLLDLDTALEWCDDQFGHLGLPFVLAHSHGALVATRYLLGENPRPIAALAMTSPYFALAAHVSLAKRIAGRIAAVVAPWVGFSADWPGEWLTHDPEIIALLKEDPLKHRIARAGWYYQAMAAQRFCLKNADKLRLPLLVLAAGDDLVADTAVTQEFVVHAGSADKQSHTYRGLRHEVLLELDADEVHGHLLDWLDEHASLRIKSSSYSV